jgi:hypothetical protein
VPGEWQPGFICDQCPECSFGDIDLQKGGDGRWKVGVVCVCVGAGNDVCVWGGGGALERCRGVVSV